MMESEVSGFAGPLSHRSLLCGCAEFGWSGAAGTSGFALMKPGLRSSIDVQYKPQSKLPILKEFPKAVGADLIKQGKAPA